MATVKLVAVMIVVCRREDDDLLFLTLLDHPHSHLQHVVRHHKHHSYAYKDMTSSIATTNMSSFCYEEGFRHQRQQSPATITVSMSTATSIIVKAALA